MKVIAVNTGGYDGNKYVCEVSHRELEKYLNLYYGNLKNVKSGDEIDLAKGYDFHTDTKSALRATEDFLKANAQVVNAITSGILLSMKSETSGK